MSTSTLKTGLNTFTPVTMNRAQDGVLYIANGIDRPMRWDGRTAEVENAGVDPPLTSCDMTAHATAGTIYGSYKAYVRALDDDDVPSNFSPVADVTIASDAPKTGVKYASVPVVSDDRITKREIWRNTAGQEIAWYRDVEIDDNTTTTGYSTRTDGELVTQTSLRYLTEDGWPNARRFGVPPDWMSVCVPFMDRMWYGVPVDYIEGQVTSISGTTIQSVATRFPSTFAGRNLRVAGYKEGTISTVDGITGLTLSTSLTMGYGTAKDNYAITKGDAEKNRVHFSKAGEPESFPKDDDGNYTNVLEMYTDGDELTAMMPAYNHLYVFKHRHLYRLATAGDPRRDAGIALVARRGCLNQRCWVLAEGAAFVMDRAGAYAFDGNTTTPISEPIQDYWRGEIQWGASKWFHVNYSPDEGVVRFFVSLSTDDWPRHALCFHYSTGQWTVEESPFDIGASTNCRIAGEERVVVGADETPSLLNEGVLDGCAPDPSQRSDTLTSTDQTLRGTVTSASSTSITDSGADFDFSGWWVAPDDTGAPLYVIDDNGDWQMRRIASISGTTITVQEAFDTTPSVGNAYQVGGIEFQAKFGGFQFLDEETQNKRRVQMYFQPQVEASTMNIRRYVDESDTPQNAQISYDDQVGVHIVAGSPNHQVDMLVGEGHVQTHFDAGFEGGATAERVMELELKGVGGAEKTRVYGLDVDGVER